MKITVLGTGMVGQVMAEKLISLDHEVIMGTRKVQETLSRTKSDQRTGKTFSEWHKEYPGIILSNYEELPDDSELYINATSGGGSLEALSAVGHSKLSGKVLIDISNPLDFSQGFPPTLWVCNDDSLAERIQREFPETQVVKSLNTMNCSIMVEPSLITGDHNVFMNGNEDSAKAKVKSLLMEFGWKESNIIDMGDISTARGTEMILPIWVRLYGSYGHGNFNFHIAKA